MRLILVFFILASQTVYSQIDTLFWFAAPEVVNTHSDRPIRFIVSSFSEKATVKVDMPSNPSFIPVEISMDANSSSVIDLTDQIDLVENRSYNTINQSGLRIQSTNLISAYYEVLGTKFLPWTGLFGVTNTDIFTLKGTNALGLEFYLPFQTRFNNATGAIQDSAWAAAEILATEDNTTIDIFPTQPFFGHSTPFSITLNKGEVYTLRADTVFAGLRPMATKIVANKPISITTNDDSILHPDGGWDLIGDQLIPISKLGFEYIIRTGFAYIICTKDNTQILLDGVLDTSLNEGQFYEIEVTEKTHYLKSNQPISVFQLVALGGELGAAILPQVNCTGSNSIRFTRSTDEPFFLDLIAKKGSENDFELNGNPNLIASSDFDEVPGTNGKWLFASIDFSSQAFIKTNELTKVTNKMSPFHLGILNGQPGETGARYGYFSNFGSFDLGPDIEVCGSDTVEISGGLGRNSYLWSTIGSPNLSQSEILEVTESGVYKLIATEGVNCQIEDSIEVTFFDLPQVKLDYVTKFCEGDSTTIKATNGYEKYNWNTSAIDDSLLTVKNAGSYFVTVTDSNSCINTSDTATISRTPLPKVQLGKETQMLCAGTSKTFSLDTQFNYIWENGSTDSKRTISENGLYSVKAFNECDTVTDEVVINTWDIDYPNVITPNGDGKNEAFVVSGISYGAWRLEINNRYGKIVYQSDDYQNDYIPENLSDGIYYFILSQDDECNTFKGWIQVIR